jgi:transcriptional regulator with XRE-family HTH domain
MKLADYLKQDAVTATSIADATGAAVSTITRAARGEVFPSRELMQRIFEATGGQVTPNDFVWIDEDAPPPFPKPTRRTVERNQVVVQP